MSTIRELIHDRAVYAVDADQTVQAVTEYMVERNIGAVPVLRDGRLAGIFSERDAMKRVLVEGRDARSTRVAEVMTRDPRTVGMNETLENCMVLMREHGFRHLPIVDGDRVKGLVSLRDILLRDLTDKDDEVRQMRAYIQAGQ